MTGTALARPIENIQKELHDLFMAAGDQPTREQRASQCARMSELHDALNAKALSDGSLFVGIMPAKRIGGKGMGPKKKLGRRVVSDVVTEVFGLTLGQQKNMLVEARNPERAFAKRKKQLALQTFVRSVSSLLVAIEKVYDRSSPEDKRVIRGFCKQVASWK